MGTKGPKSTSNEAEGSIKDFGKEGAQSESKVKASISEIQNKVGEQKKKKKRSCSIESRKQKQAKQSRSIVGEELPQTQQ